MKKMIKAAIGLLVLTGLGWLLGGQLFSRYTFSNDVVVSDVFDGPISVIGANAQITVESGSVVETITLLGTNNTVRIEPGARVDAIRGAGTDNNVVAPAGASIDTSMLQGATLEDSNALPSPSTLDGL
jgi:hypothetical protein